MKLRAIFSVCAVVLLTVSCHKAPAPNPKPAPQPKKTEPAAKTVTESPLENSQINENALGNNSFSGKSVDDLNREETLQDVYFDFDKSALTGATRDELAKHAEWLKAHPSVKIVIEGHCDERGTEQYNMALGDRRATSVKNYLISLGISPDRMRTISYGELRPKVKGHGEWAWSQNRRCHFVIVEK
ncbi:MAG: peptidoglycan-associated lipoprotein Pal [Acidobacteria bacterium]|nr:peptidoglycan-associated lipoprotein Pal [Acidobacteriota bacterium]